MNVTVGLLLWPAACAFLALAVAVVLYVRQRAGQRRVRMATEVEAARYVDLLVPVQRDGTDPVRVVAIPTQRDGGDR